jgi:hypothetical protein
MATLNSRIASLVTTIAAAFNSRVQAPASGYDVAVLNGYTGTQAQWLAAMSGAKAVSSLTALNAAVPGSPVGQLYSVPYFVLDAATGLRHRFSLWQVVDSAVTAGTATVAVPVGRIQLEAGATLTGNTGQHTITLNKATLLSNAIAALPNLALYGGASEVSVDAAVLRWNSAVWQFVDSGWYPYIVAGTNIGGNVGGKGYRWQGTRLTWVYNITITAAAGSGAVPTIGLPVAQASNGDLPVGTALISVNGVRYAYEMDFADVNTLKFRYLTSNGNLADVTTSSPVGMNPGALYLTVTYDTY